MFEASPQISHGWPRPRSFAASQFTSASGSGSCVVVVVVVGVEEEQVGGIGGMTEQAEGEHDASLVLATADLRKRFVKQLSAIDGD